MWTRKDMKTDALLMTAELALPDPQTTALAQWDGYLPPAIYEGQANTSLYRAALIDILHAVDMAERESS